MDTVESLNQSAWDCKYDVVFIPKCRRKALYGDLRERRLYENLYPFCVRSVGGIGPQPHPSFIEVFG